MKKAVGQPVGWYEVAMWIAAFPCSAIVVGVLSFNLAKFGAVYAAWAQAVGSMLAILASGGLAIFFYRLDQHRREAKELVSAKSGALLLRHALGTHRKSLDKLGFYNCWASGGMLTFAYTMGEDLQADFRRELPWKEVASLAQVPRSLLELLPATSSMAQLSGPVHDAIHQLLKVEELYESLGVVADSDGDHLREEFLNANLTKACFALSEADRRVQLAIISLREPFER